MFAHLITCDYLELSCALQIKPAEFIASLNCGWIKQTRTKHYISRYQNEHFHIMFEPSTPVIASNCCLVKVNNYLFYSMSLEDIIILFKSTFKEVEFKFINRIDVAFDSEQEFLSKTFKADFSRLKRARWSNDGELETVNIGSGFSNLSLEVYNKSAELKCSQKTYITEYFTDNGLNADNITRVEFKVKNLNTYQKYDGMTLNDINFALALNIFLDMNCQFTYTVNRPNYNKKCKLIDITHSKESFRRKKPTKQTSRMEKYVLKKIVEKGIEFENNDYLNIAYDYLNRGRLDLYIREDLAELIFKGKIDENDRQALACGIDPDTMQPLFELSTDEPYREVNKQGNQQIIDFGNHNGI